jgi:hypothetical protein
MKIKIENYTFDATAKTVTFSDYTSIRLDSILLITNVTDNIIIYNFADPLVGGTVLNNVLTLTYDTSLMDNGDKLQIFYDDGLKSANSDNQITLNSLITALNNKVATEDSLMLLRQIRTILYNHGNADGAKRQVVSINLPGAAVTTTLPISGTVTANANVTTFGGFDPRWNIYDISHVRYATAIRNNLSFN